MMSSEERDDFDVVVVGAGTAGLCAAIAAGEHPARVLLLEKTPRSIRGGNGRFTRGGMMFTHDGIKDPEIRALLASMDIPEGEISSLDLPGHSPDDFYALLMDSSEGLADPDLCEQLVKQSNPTIGWLRRLGVHLQLNSVIAKRAGVKAINPGVPGVVGIRGGGEGLVDEMFDIAERKGVEVRYETKAVRLLMDDRGEVCGVRTKGKEGFRDVRSGAVVLASGGFEANPEMRTKYLGREWDTVKIRGSRYNTGEGLNMALEIGAQPTGPWSGCHAILIDLNAPEFGGGHETGRNSYTFGIMVNGDGKRFTDEGEDFDPYTYSKMGGIALAQPRGVVFQIFDSKVLPLLQMAYHETVAVEADSIEELARNLDMNPVQLVKTVKEFNEAVQEGIFDTQIKDGKRTEGISPRKTNWAQRIDTPPFKAYPVTAGMSMTYGGIKTDKDGKVMDTEGHAIPGLYAAGEMVGGFYYHNYAPATGITKNVVFGRIAGTQAAKSGAKR
jgi:tricarballylate dehydrogenase